VVVARAALGLVAGLHFRPNTSTCVSDTLLVDGPHSQQLGDDTKSTAAKVTASPPHRQVAPFESVFAHTIASPHLVP
jgi:hypothetical protein